MGPRLYVLEDHRGGGGPRTLQVGPVAPYVVAVTRTRYAVRPLRQLEYRTKSLRRLRPHLRPGNLPFAFPGCPGVLSFLCRSSHRLWARGDKSLSLRAISSVLPSGPRAVATSGFSVRQPSWRRRASRARGGSRRVAERSIWSSLSATGRKWPEPRVLPRPDGTQRGSMCERRRPGTHF